MPSISGKLLGQEPTLQLDRDLMLALVQLGAPDPERGALGGVLHQRALGGGERPAGREAHAQIAGLRPFDDDRYLVGMLERGPGLARLEPPRRSMLGAEGDRLAGVADDLDLGGLASNSSARRTASSASTCCSDSDSIAPLSAWSFDSRSAIASAWVRAACSINSSARASSARRRELRSTHWPATTAATGPPARSKTPRARPTPRPRRRRARASRGFRWRSARPEISFRHSPNTADTRARSSG